MVSTGIYVGNPQDVPINALENLKVDEIQDYGDYLYSHKVNSHDTVYRKYASLKSLFHYLSQETEDEHNYPYLKRNVMVKVNITYEQTTNSVKAKRIEKKLLNDKEISDFRLFISEGFDHIFDESSRVLSSHKKNKGRNLALISLILGSGLLISEALSLDMNNIDWEKEEVLIYRKDNVIDNVRVSEIAMQDLKAYVDIRNKIYKINDVFQAVFISLPTGPHGSVGRLTVRSSQKMLERYVIAFGRPDITTYNLRHSFANNFYKKNKQDIIQLKEQLGHSDLNTTMIYTEI
jgi:integrase